MIVDFRNPSMPPLIFFSFKGSSSSQRGLGLRVEGFLYHITITFTLLHIFLHMVVAIALTFSLTIVAIMVQLHSHIVIIMPLSSPQGLECFVFFGLLQVTMFLLFSIFSTFATVVKFFQIIHCFWQHHDKARCCFCIVPKLVVFIFPIKDHNVQWSLGLQFMCYARACYLCLPCQKSKCSMFSSLQFMCYAKAYCFHVPHQQLECSMFFGLLQVTMVLISLVFSAFIILVKCFHVTHHLGIIMSWVLFMCSVRTCVVLVYC